MGFFSPTTTVTVHVYATVLLPQPQIQQKVGTHQSKPKPAINVPVDVPTATSTQQEMTHMLSVVMIIVVKALFVRIVSMDILWSVASVRMRKAVSCMRTF